MDNTEDETHDAEDDDVDTEEKTIAEEKEISDIILIEDTVTADGEGNVNVRFVAPPEYSGFIAVMIEGAANPLVTCNVNDDIAVFTYKPKSEDTKVSFRVLDSNQFYGEFFVKIQW